MINLQHPFEKVDLPNGDRATIVDIPSHNLNQGEKIIDDYLEEIGHKRHDIKKRYSGAGNQQILETWEEYLNDWIMIWQSYRKDTTVDIKKGKTDYGVPYWGSLTECIRQVSDTMKNWLVEKLNDFKDKITPDIDNLTPEKASQLVENILKKKNLEGYVDTFRWTGLRNYITVLEKKLLKSQEENLLNISSIKQLKKQNESCKNIAAKK